jgi:hypothetical protein
MKYDVEMGAQVPNFIKIGSDIQTLMGGGDARRAW